MIRSAIAWPRKVKPLQLPDTQLRGERVILRFAQPQDWREWAELRSISRDHLVPFEPEWSPDSLTEMHYLRRLSRQARDWTLGLSRTFLIFLQDGTLVGGINVNNICRGAAQFGSLGYWLGQPYQSYGYMHESANIVLHYAFNEIDLHRINAATLTHNGRSIKMLRRLGFEEEGFAKAYIQINGDWQDHVLFGLTVESYREGLSITA
jgi:ribosomal-protein-alanine N-acetyltransferase